MRASRAIGGHVACTVPQRSYRRTSAGSSTYPYTTDISLAIVMCLGWLPGVRVLASTGAGTFASSAVTNRRVEQQRCVATPHCLCPVFGPRVLDIAKTIKLSPSLLSTAPQPPQSFAQFILERV